VTTVMGDLIIAAPRRYTEYVFRPYMVGGGGLMRLHSDDTFSAVPFDPLQVVRTPVGTLTLSFRDGDNATFAYTMALGNPPVSVVQTKQLTRQVFRTPGTVCQ